MEIKIEVLKSAIELSKDAIKHKRLEDILTNLEVFTVEDIINNTTGFSFHNEIYSILATIASRSKLDNEIFVNQAVTDLSEVIALENYYLKSGFSQKNFKCLLFFIMINCYIRIPVKTLIDNLEIGEAERSEIVGKLKLICDGFHGEIGVPPKAPYHEKKWVINFNEGYSENNLEKVYEFVLAVERGGTIGFHFNFMLENVVRMLFEIDPTSFHECLVKRTRVSDFIFFTQWLALDSLLTFCENYEFENKWLKFELLRQILKHENAIENFEDNLLVLNKLQRSICLNDAPFFCSVILHFKGSVLFYSALGITLSALDETTLTAIVEKCFVFSTSAIYIEQNRELLNTYNKQGEKTNINEFLDKVFLKWELFCNSLIDDQDQPVSDLVLTDFAYLVVAYYSGKNVEFIVNEINNLLFRLRYHGSFWYGNKTQYTANFFLELSKLNLLSYAYRSICEQEQLSREIDCLGLFSNTMIKARFFNKIARKDSIEQIKLNLSFRKYGI